MCRQAQGYAVVVNEVLRLLRLRSVLEIRWRPDNRHAHVRSNTHGYHTTRHLLTAANASVEALGDNVRQPVVDNDLDLDVGIFSKKVCKLGQKDSVRRIFGSCDPNSAGGLLSKFAHGGQLGLDLLEPRPHSVKQAFARLGQRNAARRSGQKANAKPRLELTDGLAQRRLRDAKLRCRFRKALLSRYRDKGPEVVQTPALHLFVLLISPCGL